MNTDAYLSRSFFFFLIILSSLLGQIPIDVLCNLFGVCKCDKVNGCLLLPKEIEGKGSS